MSVNLKKRYLSVEFDVADEEPMRSLLGPDSMMMPFLATVEVVDDMFRQVTIWGHVVNGKGQILKREHARSYTLDMLTSPHPEDPIPTWLRKIVIGLI